MNPRYQLSGRDRELTIHDRDGIFAPAVDDSTLGIAFELSEVIRDKRSDVPTDGRYAQAPNRAGDSITSHQGSLCAELGDGLLLQPS